MCIEKPENGLYHKLLETLAAEFRIPATGKKRGSMFLLLLTSLIHGRFTNILESAEFPVIRGLNQIKEIKPYSIIFHPELVPT